MRVVKELLKRHYSIEHIENAFVRLFLARNELVVKHNKLLLAIMNDTHGQVVEIKSYLESKMGQLGLQDLITVFETLIPVEDKSVNGAFFTPHLITSQMVPQVIQTADDKVCDPACGCGAFLLEATEYLARTYRKSIAQIVAENIFGADLADYSIRRCQILLSLLALGHGEDVDLDFNLLQANSLKVDWRQKFKAVFVTQGGFDVVVGNPPYVKFQDLPSSLREDLYHDWVTLKRGNYNLYFAFFELGVQLLNADGRLAYICPNNYFTSLAALHLREYLQENQLVAQIIDFTHLKIFEAQTYTCITCLNKKRSDEFEYAKVTRVENLAQLKQLTYSSIPYVSLNKAKWRLLRDCDRDNVSKIEAMPVTLRDVADIRVGFATCRDSVYFLENPQRQGAYYSKNYRGKNYLIEPEITRLADKISEFQSQVAVEKNQRRIIFPYEATVDGGVEVISENDMQTRFPKCYEYLLTAKAELGQRDKGLKEYAAWYAYARTQGLNFRGEKLLTPTFSRKPRFFLETKSDALFCNGYALYLRGRQLGAPGVPGLQVLKAILNSEVMEYYIANTSVAIEGGYWCYQKNFIEKMGIPQLDEGEQQYLARETNLAKVNRFLTSKYGLSNI